MTDPSVSEIEVAREQVLAALLELFADVDTVFVDQLAFARNHRCPASEALGRIYRSWQQCRSVLESEAETYG